MSNAEQALADMVAADKILKAALKETNEEKKQELGLKFIVAAEKVDVEALGGILDYEHPTEAIEALRALRS